jgi:hypothetical protein
LGGASARGFEDDNNSISVSDPVKLDDTIKGSAIKFGQVVKYTVRGQDSEGKYEVQRRYNEFLQLS